MFTGNPHQDRTGVHERVHGRSRINGGSMPKATWQKPAPWQGDAPWKKGPLYGGGRFVNPDPFNANPKQFVNPPAEKFWNDGTLSNNPNMTQLLGDQANYSTKDRVYDDWIIKDYLQQGIISPGEVKDIGKPGYKQVVPQLMGQQLAMYKPGYPTEMDYWNDPYRDIDPMSLQFPGGGLYEADYGDDEYDILDNEPSGPLNFG
jgi:hypothetical protein